MISNELAETRIQKALEAIGEPRDCETVEGRTALAACQTVLLQVQVALSEISDRNLQQQPTSPQR